jgi:hypothetical protein
MKNWLLFAIIVFTVAIILLHDGNMLAGEVVVGKYVLTVTTATLAITECSVDVIIKNSKTGDQTKTKILLPSELEKKL